MELPKPEGHPSDSAAKPDVNLSIHPASQQSGGCHPDNCEQGRGSDDAVTPNYLDGNYWDFCRDGEPPIGLQDKKASNNKRIFQTDVSTVEKQSV